MTWMTPFDRLHVWRRHLPAVHEDADPSSTLITNRLPSAVFAEVSFDDVRWP